MNRRGAVIFVVLIAIVAMAAGLMAMLAGVRGQSESIRAIVGRHEQRLAARSATYAIAAEIYEQRDLALAGRIPVIVESEDVLRFEDAAAWQWQLESDSSGQSAEPFAARLDVNHIDDAVLRAFLNNNEIDVDHVLSHKPFRSLGKVRHAIGNSADDKVSQLLTISSNDPQLRSGAGNQAGFAGSPRVVIGSFEPTPSGMSAEGDALFQRISSGEWVPAARSEILIQLQQRALPQEEWDAMLDVFDLYNGEPQFGLIDLSYATVRVLAALPGVDDDLAASLVDHRETLTDDDLSGLTWPVRDEIMTVVEYSKVLDMLTSRSLQYAVRYSVVMEHEELDGYESLQPSSRPLQYDIVVDISGDRPRVGYLRNVTHFPWQVYEQAVLRTEQEEQSITLPAAQQPEPSMLEDIMTEDNESMPTTYTQWGRYGTGGQQK